MNATEEDSRAPGCPSDGFRMNATIVGWRCPICGLAALPVQQDALDRAKAAHPAFR